MERFRLQALAGYSGSDEVQLTGATRSANSNAAKGSLKRVIHPMGGVTEFEYENNVYVDETDANVTGGGVRVSKLTHNDGLNTNQVTTYGYNEPGTSSSTGKSVTIPVFTIAVPNSTSYGTLADKVKNSTYRSEYNLSGEDPLVVYSKVTVTRSGAGKTIYEFSTPGTWRSAASGDWSETMNYVTRHITSAPSPCSNILPDFLIPDKNMYPFTLNPNYSFERGLPTKTSYYDESGALAKEETYTFQRTHSSPVIVKALKFDDFGSTRAYGQYSILTTLGNLISSKTVKIFNSVSPTSTEFVTESEYYSYNLYRKLAETEKENSDGSVFRSRYRYVKDYSATTGSSDANNEALYQLKTNHNYNGLVETWTSVEAAGGADKVVSGTLILYKAFYNTTYSANIYLPSEVWKFTSPNGAVPFSYSSIVSNTFSKDAAYRKENTINSYNVIGQPLSVTNHVSRTNTTALYSSSYINKKLLDGWNVKPEELIYSPIDFLLPEASLSYSGSVSTTSGRMGHDYALTFPTTLTLTRNLTNAANNKDYIFSCWLKDPAGVGAITINLSATGLNQSYSINYGSSIANWTYYEVRIPKPAQSSFLVTVSTSASVSIDDILMYPDNASVTTYAYKVKQYGTSGNGEVLLSATTGLNGVSTYYDYDGNGRLYTTRDQDRNIIELRNYTKVHTSGSTSTSGSISWVNSSIVTGVSETFSISVTPSASCASDITYKWNFGDGSAEVTSTTPTQSHTYTSAGTFVVTCVVSIPGLPNFTVQTPSSNPGAVTVIPPPVYPVLCAAGIVEYTSGGSCIQWTCSGISGSCTSTTFKISSIPGASLSDIDAITWQKAPVGSSSWTNIGFGNTVSVSFNSSTTTSYKVRCLVVMANNATGTSDEIAVYNNY